MSSDKNQKSGLSTYSTSLLGIVLFICFFLPALKGCKAPVYPYRESLGYAPPYFFGLITAIFSLSLLFKFRTGIVKTLSSLQILLFLLVLAMTGYIFIFEAGIMQGIIKKNLNDHTVVIGIHCAILFLLWIPLVIFNLSKDLKKLALNSIWLGALYLSLWFSFWLLITSVNRIYYGLYTSLAASVLLVISGYFQKKSSQ